MNLTQKQFSVTRGASKSKFLSVRRFNTTAILLCCLLLQPKAFNQIGSSVPSLPIESRDSLRAYEVTHVRTLEVKLYAGNASDGPTITQFQATGLLETEEALKGAIASAAVTFLHSPEVQEYIQSHLTNLYFLSVDGKSEGSSYIVCNTLFHANSKRYSADSITNDVYVVASNISSHSLSFADEWPYGGGVNITFPGIRWATINVLVPGGISTYVSGFNAIPPAWDFDVRRGYSLWPAWLPQYGLASKSVDVALDEAFCFPIELLGYSGTITIGTATNVIRFDLKTGRKLMGDRGPLLVSVSKVFYDAQSKPTKLRIMVAGDTLPGNMDESSDFQTWRAADSVWIPDIYRGKVGIGWYEISLNAAHKAVFYRARY